MLWKERMLAFSSTGLALVVTGFFIWIMSGIFRYGFSKLSWEYFTSSPLDSGRSGGIASILVATFMILFVCLAATLPLGLGSALFLAEYVSRENVWGRLVRRSLDVLAGMPSIVFGLFGNAFFCVTLGLGFSILSGGLTLACMILPVFIRSTEEGFRLVPESYRQGAEALGLSRTTTIFRVLLPPAFPGLVVGLILGIGRALAETAALIFTSGYVDRMPESFLDSGRTLSIHIYDLAMNVPGGNDCVYTAALVLIVILLLSNQTASWITKRYLSEGAKAS
jgi:phosphate transport system permease protein